VRYEIVAEPRVVYACHCSDCQTASGSSFLLAMRVPSGGVKVTRGSPASHERSRADGRKKDVYRCPQCLCALWSAGKVLPDYVTVYAGTLDNTSDLRPVAHLWTSDAQPWFAIPKEALAFEKGPPDMKALEEAWRAGR
jgi:hypothetical protein